jgi:hypothetical protein
MKDESRAVYVTTRRQLRGVAESLIAGPQYRAAGTIKLAVRTDGFTGVAVPLRVHGDQFVWGPDGVRLAGPLSDIADAAGVQAGPPEGVYDVVDPLPDDAILDIDRSSAELLYRSLYAGGFALERVLPGGHPVLWPEHFDVAVTADEVNYGVSAGDDYHALPYAYVGPWQARTGEFWNAPFGSVQSLDPNLDVDGLAASVADFFHRGQDELRSAR